MVICEVVEEQFACFGARGIALVARASEDVVDVFFPGAAVEASSVYAVVLGGTLVQCWCPVVRKLC